MSETDFIAWAYKAGWSGVALLLSYSVYIGIKGMVPVWADRYKAHTHRISAKDAQRAEHLVQKLRINGAEMRVIEDQLIGSLRFKELFFDARLAGSHRFRNIESTQAATAELINALYAKLERKLGEHVEEDRQVHERVRALEVRMEDVKGDIHEIKEVQVSLRNLVEEKAEAIREKLQESQERIVQVLERRKEPRG